MSQDKEQIKQTLEEFFKNVDEIVKPYFDQLGFKRSILRGRSMVLFEKVVGESLVTVDYFCYIKYGLKAFRATFGYTRKCIFIIKMDESLSDNDPWKYENEDDLKRLLSESVKKIDKQCSQYIK